jgi:cytochrome c-type biogenesis protein CcmH/NrfF
MHVLLAAVLAASVADGATARQVASAERSSTAQAFDSTAVHPEARAAIDRLWSPYCPGMMLEVCPSPGGAMLRDSIDRMARSGLDADSIIELMLADYGEEYRAEPRSEGVGGLAWYIPPAALVAGLVVVGAFLARRRGLRRFGRPDPTPPTDADQERLREAMARLDEEERPDF